MSAIDPKVKNILDERLAKGEIDIKEYQHLINTMVQNIDSNNLTPIKSVTHPLSNSGSLLHSWRGTNWECRFHNKYKNNSNLTNHLKWINGETDYIITDEYLIILSGFPATKIREAAKATAILGTTGGLAGAAFISLPSLLVGEASDKLFGKKNKFSLETLAEMYDEGHAIYSKKSDLIYNAFLIESGYLLVHNHAIVSVIGKFQSSLMGDIDLCVLLNESFGSVVKHLKSAGCRINEHPQVLQEEVLISDHLPKEYVDLKNPRHISHDKLAICVKCTNYISKKSWLGKRGDQKSVSKPSDDRLPCRIPVETSSAWDDYFLLPVGERNYLYPINCSKFIRK